MRHSRRSLLVVVTAASLVATSACSDVFGDDEDASGGTTSLPPVVSSTTVPGATTAPPVVESNLQAVSVGLEEILSLDQPVAMAVRAGDPTIFLAEQGGRVRRLEVRDRTNDDGDVVGKSYSLDNTFLDLRDATEAEGEQGLLGLTFSPDGRKVVVHFTDNAGDTNVEELRVDGDEAEDRRRLLYLDQPFGNHNGGQVAYGPDGFLYIGLGDGGGAGDPQENGQNPQTLLGTILRIDPDGRADDVPYGIPASNPFADGVDGAPEVWLFGARNPWRFSFDRATDDLWVADVGQDEIEEITYLPAAFGGGRGANLGWDDMEGSQLFEAAAPPPGHVGPIHTYDRADGECSVIGGYVYRGAAIPELTGAYVYGDFCTGEVRALAAAGSTVVADEPLGITVPGLVAFGEDTDGELWTLSNQGPVSKIIPVAPPPPPDGAPAEG